MPDNSEPQQPERPQFEQQPDIAYFGPGAQGTGTPPDEPASRNGVLRIGIIAAVLALLVGAGAFAYLADPLHLFRAGPQAAQAIPSGALFYAGVDADPSAKQKIDAVRFLNHFPAFSDNTGGFDENTDVRKKLLGDALTNLDCPGVSYDTTLAPWLGKRFGVAAMKGTGSQPDVVLAAEVTDDGAAKDGLAALSQCASDGGDEFGYAFVNGYVLLAQSQDLASTYAKQADDSSLADDADFRDDVASLGEQGVATMWVDVARAVDSYRDVSLGTVTADQLDLVKSLYGRAAITMRFGSDNAEIATSVHGDTADIDHNDNEIVNLPESTFFAISESGGANRIDASWDVVKKALSAEGVDVEQALSDLEAQTGFSLPTDLETLFGDNLLVAVDETGIDAAGVTTDDLSQLDIGVRFTGDSAKLADLYDRIISLLEQSQGAVTLSRHDTDDGMVIASNDDYAGTLAGNDGSLGDSETFRSVVDDAANKELVVYLDWDAIESRVLSSIAEDSSGSSNPRIAENLMPLRAIGMSAEVDGNYTLSTLRVSLND